MILIRMNFFPTELVPFAFYSIVELNKSHKKSEFSLTERVGCVERTNRMPGFILVLSI